MGGKVSTATGTRGAKRLIEGLPILVDSLRADLELIASVAHQYEKSTFDEVSADKEALALLDTVSAAAAAFRKTLAIRTKPELDESLTEMLTWFYELVREKKISEHRTTQLKFIKTILKNFYPSADLSKVSRVTFSKKERAALGGPVETAVKATGILMGYGNGRTKLFKSRKKVQSDAITICFGLKLSELRKRQEARRRLVDLVEQLNESPLPN